MVGSVCPLLDLTFSVMHQLLSLFKSFTKVLQLMLAPLKAAALTGDIKLEEEGFEYFLLRIYSLPVSQQEMQELFQLVGEVIYQISDFVYVMFFCDVFLFTVSKLNFRMPEMSRCSR